ncbi:wall-associated receptor kinase-like 8 isoform X2 [Olea europaea var. sylvestris]|uniref:Serine threonine kinase n=2 Tax=Olea europaea subsp. europaea TaxID=158383 RepID=A0A8S0RVY1_OLEEU|nr:wall-associated receptor kinase-like 8 isoform X2 [Olea europaea var. sylvestris]CAA2984265.1 Serine threonine kinase [Olea europaea subsp. europaea]
MTLHWLRYISLSLLVMIPMAIASPMSKPNCRDKCGNVTIPYPFGIGPECSHNLSFTVNCQNLSNAAKPFLSGINLEVLEISLKNNTITLNQPVSPINCSYERTELSLGKSLLGTPFIFSSSYNVLVVLGCKNVVTVRKSKSTTAGGCLAICGNGSENSTDTSCNGVNCCQASILDSLRELHIIYMSIGANKNKSFCGYTFLVYQRWIQTDYRKYSGFQYDSLYPFDEEFVYAPVVLDWKVPIYARNGVYCRFIGPYNPNRLIDYENSVKCSCKQGYDGNPYLEEGCQDIDECSNSTLNYCGDWSCVNLPGTYSCRVGTSGSNRSRVKVTFIAVGSGIGALVLLVGAWRSYKVIRRRIKANRKKRFFKRNGGLLLEQQLSSAQNGVDRTKLFSSKELELATNHFNVNRILGRGGQGTVYKGMLSDGRIVAVKKSQKVDEDDLEVFINEVVILSQINHRNVVKILGCCLETEVPLLVYEFIPNDTLFQHIHNPTEEFPLTWEMRLRIATEVASALSYLHFAASLPIYHRDIKSTNILLDDKYRAKVSDFGTSRSVAIDQTHLTTKVIGTFGYLDPEYFQSSQFTEKSDVYSFGVVMVELLTGQKAISSIRSQDKGKSLATNFLQAMEEKCLHDILDADVLNEDTKEEIMAFAQLARRCLYLNGKRRPTMKEVAVELEAIQMSKRGSSVQENLGDKEHPSIIEVSEAYDFASISASINFDNITISSTSDVDPLLSATS